MELRTCLNTHHTVMQAWSPLAAGGYGLLKSKMLRELGAQYGKSLCTGGDPVLDSAWNPHQPQRRTAE